MSSIIEWCRKLATFSEEDGKTTRTFLSPPMHDVHRELSDWMRSFGMEVRVDAVGNLRGVLAGDRPRIMIGSHLDTVPDAGAFDGILGVVIGIALAEVASRRPHRPAIEVIGFSEEEGVRYGVPFIGSRAVAGTLDAPLIEMITPALRDFGLDPAGIPQCRFAPETSAYIEFHIEQGPVLESLGIPIACVDAIAGQTRGKVVFEGDANHAGTTPMAMRRDALTSAARWIVRVQKQAHTWLGLVATVGKLDVYPNATNVIPSRVIASLDVRHWNDEIRHEAVRQFTSRVNWTELLDQPAASLRVLDRTMHSLTSGAGYDAMILAPQIPASMIFLRSPGGQSHSPLESVLPGDVDAAMAFGERILGL